MKNILIFLTLLIGSISYADSPLFDGIGGFVAPGGHTFYNHSDRHSKPHYNKNYYYPNRNNTGKYSTPYNRENTKNYKAPDDYAQQNNIYNYNYQ